MSPGATPKRARRQRVDLHVGLEHAALGHRQNGVENPGQAGRGDGRVEHVRVAIGENGEAGAGCFERREHTRHLRIGGRVS